LAIFQNKNFA
jgi:hypothetical protein